MTGLGGWEALPGRRNRPHDRGDHEPIQALLEAERRVELAAVTHDDEVEAGDNQEQLLTGAGTSERILGSRLPEPGAAGNAIHPPPQPRVARQATVFRDRLDD